MLARTVVITVMFAFVVNTAFAGQYTLNTAQKEVVSSWLAKHPGYRIARDKDCDCNEDLQKIRHEGYGGHWRPIPTYRPYQVAGDLNGDGELDFAVVILPTNGSQEFTIVVFNGPGKANEAPSTFQMTGSIHGVGLFFGPPRPKPYRLVIGEFESEGYVLLPKGRTYRLEPISSENE